MSGTRTEEEGLFRAAVIYSFAEAFIWPVKLRRLYMINYEEELKKFKPSLDVDEAEGAIYSRDLTDVIDILKEMLKETSEQEKDR